MLAEPTDDEMRIISDNIEKLLTQPHEEDYKRNLEVMLFCVRVTRFALSRMTHVLPPQPEAPQPDNLA